MKNDFKIQVHFDEDGEDIEIIIGTYISSILENKNQKNNMYKNNLDLCRELL